MKTIQAGSSRLTKRASIVWLGLPMAIGLTAMLCASVQAAPVAYSFRKILTLGDPVPGGGNHINDFEPGNLNNRGDAVFGTDLGTSADPTTGFGEGVFLLHAGRISECARLAGAFSPPATVAVPPKSGSKLRALQTLARPLLPLSQTHLAFSSFSALPGLNPFRNTFIPLLHFRPESRCME